MVDQSASLNGIAIVMPVDDGCHHLIYQSRFQPSCTLITGFAIMVRWWWFPRSFFAMMVSITMSSNGLPTLQGGCIQGSPSICMGRRFVVLGNDSWHHQNLCHWYVKWQLTSSKSLSLACEMTVDIIKIIVIGMWNDSWHHQNHCLWHVKWHLSSSSALWLLCEMTLAFSTSISFSFL